MQGKGKNRYRRNAKDRARLIDMLEASNLSLPAIAARLGMSADTLRSYYPKEIAEAGRRPQGFTFNPTEEQRKIVRAAVSYGMAVSEIATLIGPDGVSEHIIRKHFPQELLSGRAQSSFKVANSLYRMATGWMNGAGGGKPDRVSVDAAKFWAERRMGWTAHSSVDLNLKRDPSEYTDDELAALVSRSGAGATEPEDGEEVI